MTAPTNTVTTLTSKGNREDLENVIYRVAPEKTPFMSSIGNTTAKAVFHEWQVETLATPSATNYALEGDDIGTFDAGNYTTRVGNTNQIFRKSGLVSGSQDAVQSAGRDSEYARQKILKGLELRRDMEMRFLGNYASKADESGATPRTSGGALAWMTSNVSRGTSGANGGYSAGVVAAATNGTQRTFTEALVKTVLASCFANGGSPTMLFMGPAHKQQASAFTGIAQNRHETGTGKVTIVAGADIYASDFGDIAFVPHAYALTRDAVAIDPDYWAVATLRPVTDIELATTGDAKKFELVAEKTLVSRNEKSSGVVADLT